MKDLTDMLKGTGKRPRFIYYRGYYLKFTEKYTYVSDGFDFKKCKRLTQDQVNEIFNEPEL